MNQITIYDLLPDEPRPNFRAMNEDQVASYIGEVLGVNFLWNETLEEYTATIKKTEHGKFFLEFHFSKYSLMSDNPKNGQVFLSCGAVWSDGGSGRPCDSLEEAIKFYKNYI